ncbi:ribosome assembly cofactor RimP [Flavicella marina]|uniref:ribosome assembly cofactor RimP n=1 Tax=Flavicella marina TaxID=1475951 RepID=UPI001264CCB5|nr:ribosome assembly cofactor RimP [Flavicella marina]
MNKELIKELVHEALEESPLLFLIDLEFLADSKISIIIDGDEGVPLNECIRISRAVESKLDREEEDFSLEVSSPDITKPLLVFRQYKKNIGRTLAVKTADEKFEGKLVEVLDDQIVLTWSAREPKPIGKGKVTVQKSVTIPHNNIVEAKVKLIF